MTATAVSIDDDTLAAVRQRWQDEGNLPSLFDKPPESGRLHAPQTSPYAQLASELMRRVSAGTGGAWHDYRRVTVTLRGVKADVIAGVAAVKAVFNRDVTLTYPSGARFKRWWPADSDRLGQEDEPKEGQDVWQAIIEAEVWSIRRD